MAQQLIYTSYPESLVHGRTGFSTVARCRDMPDRLVAEIERASQYDIPSGTVFAHRILSVGAGVYHLLTRAKDCGSDYTSRNNHIAHHLVFRAEEIAETGQNPADIMLNWPHWLDAFEGAPRYLPEIDPREFAKLKPSALPAETWRNLFGDCAFAASLGGSARVRARAGDARALLKLFAESLLLARLKRADWDITFTTRLLPSDSPADFKWAASCEIPAGEADVDLVEGRAKAPPPGRAAEYARTGAAKNSELLDLKVSDGALGRRQFNVVETNSRDRKPVYIGAAAGAAILAAALAYVLAGSPREPSPNKSAPESVRLADIAPQKPAAETAAPRAPESPAPKTSSAEIPPMRALANAREKINSGEFAEALAYWEAHGGAAREKYRGDLADDIRAKTKSMLRYAENVALAPDCGSAERDKALRNLDALEKSRDFIPPDAAKFLPQKIEELRRILKK